MPYLLFLKKQQNLKLSSAANYRWRFMGYLLTEHHLEFLSLKGGCTGSSESTLVKMPHCWKSHVAAQILLYHSKFAATAVRYKVVILLLLV